MLTASGFPSAKTENAFACYFSECRLAGRKHNQVGFAQVHKAYFLGCKNAILYAFGQRAAEILETSRQTVADCLGAKSPKEIYFTSCGS